KLNKCLITACPLPVRHIRRALDHIAFPEDLLRAAFFLVVADPACSQYNLSGRMGMPVRSHAGAKITFPTAFWLALSAVTRALTHTGSLKLSFAIFLPLGNMVSIWLLSCWAIAWKAGNSSKVMATAKHDV